MSKSKSALLSILPHVPYIQRIEIAFQCIKWFNLFVSFINQSRIFCIKSNLIKAFVFCFFSGFFLNQYMLFPKVHTRWQCPIPFFFQGDLAKSVVFKIQLLNIWYHHTSVSPFNSFEISLVFYWNQNIKFYYTCFTFIGPLHSTLNHLQHTKFYFLNNDSD